MRHKLLEKLKEEYKTLPETSIFGGNNYKEQYPAIFTYLETNEPIDAPEEWELYWNIVTNFDQVCEDYGVEYRKATCPYCEKEMKLIQFTGYYDEFRYWRCDNCTEIEVANPDYEEQGAYT